MKTKLDPKDALDVYDQFYIGESQNGSFCADAVSVSMYVLTSAWDKLRVRVRTRDEEKLAAKQRGQRWEWPAGEPSPTPEPVAPVATGAEPDTLDSIPALEAVGEKVTFDIHPDGRITDVAHDIPLDPNLAPAGPSPLMAADMEGDFVFPWSAAEANSDPGPGRRAIQADEFNDLLGKIQEDAPAESPVAGTNGTTRHIITAINLRIEDDSYLHPIMGDIDRLFGRFCTGGIPAHKAVKAALRAAELARQGAEK